MGKMKELYMQQLEERLLAPDYPEEPEMCSNKTPQLMCPNCNEGVLDVDYSTNEAVCYKCGYDFVHIGKTKFKFK